MASTVSQFLSTPNSTLIPCPAPVLSLTRGICFGSMASSAKRRAVGMGENPADSEDNSSDEGLEDDVDSAENNSGSEEEIHEEVIVDFEAHTITHNDYNGVKKLMQQLFLKARVNTSELTDLLIQQNHIGSVIRQAEVPEDSDDDEDPADEVFGFISMLNLTERKVRSDICYL
ncbi:protein BCCIP homolog, partial [Salvelinus sp. IW2-2015]|uniref:protein BCCIP homolog n=1 Tax=Salvelinus sp. IW2-2015 TaxID=2691554 RepID=UPI0038D3D414